MSAVFAVQQAGLGNSIQDSGRAGFRHQGVPSGGWLDAPLAACANALVANRLEAAVLELRALGPQLVLREGHSQIALAGHVNAKLVRASGLRQELPAWCSISLQAGDEVHIGAVTDGCAYLAVAGGWDGALHMGSRATYARVGLGGIGGRALQHGDVLRALPQSAKTSLALSAAPWLLQEGPIRVMLGPQADHFAPEAIAALSASDWQTTAAQDRMGVRLSGPHLAHRSAEAADIVSDGIAPGAIQVPGDGQPIVLLADCQTMGGYPKIATVISADLPRMAHLPAGARCRFAIVNAEQARAALRDQVAAWAHWQKGIRPYAEPGWLDEQALRDSNLITGVIDAQNPEP